MIERISDLDGAIVQGLFMLRDPFVVQIFFIISEFAGLLAVIGLTVIASLWFWRKGLGYYSLGLFMAVLGSEMTKAGLKLVIERPRPGGTIPVFLDDGFSFPSGHATLAVALYGSLMYAFWRMATTGIQKLGIVVVGVSIILGVGFSRLYLGLHYPSDVAGGYIVGAVWIVLGMYIGRRLYVFLQTFFSSNPKQTELRQ